MAVYFFTTPGAGTWTVPTAVTQVTVHGIGAGSSGQGGSGGNGNGGAGGSYARAILTVTPASTIYLNVGSVSATQTVVDTWANRAANSAPTLASNGIVAQGATSPRRTFAPTNIGSVTFGCSSGGSGTPNGGGGASGPNGIGASPVTVTGGTGDAGFGGTAGNAGQEWTQTSNGALAGAGGGGNGNGAVGANGSPAGLYGGGGGGGGDPYAGGSGRQGIVVIETLDPPQPSAKSVRLARGSLIDDSSTRVRMARGFIVDEVAAAGGPSVGTLTAIQDNQTLSAQASVAISGILTATQANQTLLGAANVPLATAQGQRVIALA